MPKKKQTVSKKIEKTAPKKKEISVKKEIDLKKIAPEVPESLQPAVKILTTVIMVVTALALVDLCVQYINNDYSVAVVNGSRITKSQWHDRLAATYGSGVASQLIEEEIIMLEAKKAEVTVENEEIKEELDKIIESIGGEEMFEAALKANNITVKDLENQIKIDLLATKILTPTLEYEEEDVKDFFEQYSDVIFPTETAALEDGEKLDFDTYKEETEKVFIQQEIQIQQGSWLTEKKAEYSIQDNSTDKPKYGFLTITTNIINNLFENLGGKEEVVEE